MAEALAAVGLAGSVVQFVDCGIRWVSSAVELYNSTDGSLKENSELEIVIEDVQQLRTLVLNRSTGAGSELDRLVIACSALADELSVILHDLVVEEQKNRRLESFKKSIKSLRKRNQIKNIERRLYRIRDQICVHLTVLLSDEHASLAPSLTDLKELTKSINNETKAILRDTCLTLQKQVEDKTSKNADKAMRIIKSLHFKQIRERQSNIKEAHSKTFEWMFQSGSSVNFTQWLSHEDGFYWIAGKAGSGKSTLMKFLLGHAQTKSLLRQWAGNQKLVIASHFFWSAGTTIQKSQDGLFRTLLCQILIQYPDAIPMVCGERWHDTLFDWLEEWTHAELVEALTCISNLRHVPVRYCLFIDGLDEYNGDHPELLRVLNVIVQSPNIKICASSRPWNDFLHAFNQSTWKLFVQNLTSNDIRLYVKDNLEQHPRFQVLQRQTRPGAQSLIEDIGAKADGVFLWVYLVVRSLLRGLTNRDQIFDLKRRLHNLPGDLEKYFEHMMGSIEDVYRVQTARIFRTMVASDGTLSLIAVHFLELEQRDPEYSIDQKITPLFDDQLSSTLEETKWQLNAKCRDLVQITRDQSEHEFVRDSVGFLHRTVIDFFRTKEMADLLAMRSGATFDPLSALCKISLAQIKTFPYSTITAICPVFLRCLVFTMLYHAKDIENSLGRCEYALINDLRQTMGELSSDFEAWSLSALSLPVSDIDSVADMAVRYGLQLFISEDVKCSPLPENSLPRLLQQSLKPYFEIHGVGLEAFATASNDADISMVQCVLNMGASPNALAGDSDDSRTVWGDFLWVLQTEHSKQDNSAWNMTKHLKSNQEVTDFLANAFDVCKVMIMAGADKWTRPEPSAVPHVDSPKDVNIEKIFDEIFSYSQSAALKACYVQLAPIKKSTRWWHRWPLFPIGRL